MFVLYFDGIESVKTMLEDFAADMYAGAEVAVNKAAEKGAETAKTVHRWKDKTGFLSAHIGWQPLPHINAEPRAEFFAEAEYASFINWGTKPHPIEGSPLAWREPYPDGDWVVTTHVNHPGTVPDPFMTDGPYSADIVAKSELYYQLLQVTEAAVAKANG